jgi:hypothetical protein
MPSASDALRANREQALDYSAKAGQARLAKLLAAAAKELEAKLKNIGPGGGGTYTEAQVKATLASIRAITGKVGNGVKDATVSNAETIAPMAAAGTIRYLKDLDKKFRGLGVQPLALDEAAAMDVAKEGARASVLRRLVEGVPDEQGKTKTKVGILERYGQAVVGHFEDQMRIGLVTRRPWDEMRQSLIDKSPFLQGAPAHWAERIVRTETLGAHARASLETMKHADDELGDMLKVLCATFDDRTGSDSISVHGQIRRTREFFDTWQGKVMVPPARPNDREIVVPHRMSWPMPANLLPRSDAEVHARWKAEKRKGSPPPRPRLSTVAIAPIGKR